MTVTLPKRRIRCAACMHTPAPERKHCRVCSDAYWVPASDAEITEAWRIPTNIIGATGHSPWTKNHPEAPFKVSYHTRDGAIDATVAWLELLAAEPRARHMDPGRPEQEMLWYVHTRENPYRHLGIGSHPNEKRTVVWKSEAVEVVRTPTGAFTRYRSWWQLHVSRCVELTDANGDKEMSRPRLMPLSPLWFPNLAYGEAAKIMRSAPSYAEGWELLAQQEAPVVDGYELTPNCEPIYWGDVG